MDSTIEQIAAELAVPADTIRKWRQRGVPHHRREDIRAQAAIKYGIAITREQFDKFGRRTAA